MYSGFAYVDTGTYLTLSETDMVGGSSGGAIFNLNGELAAMNIRGNDGAVLQYQLIKSNRF